MQWESSPFTLIGFVMFKMFGQLFATIQLFFMGMEKFAAGFNHLGDWGNETMASFADEARILRRAKMRDLMAEHGLDTVPVAVLKAPVSKVKLATAP